MKSTLYYLTTKMIGEKNVIFSPIVSDASHCEFTPQHTGPEVLYRKARAKKRR